MEKYIVIAAKANFLSGILELTKEQYTARSHALKSLKKGQYEILLPVEFKRGEEIGYDGEICKSLLSNIAEVANTEESAGNKKAPTDIDEFLNIETGEILVMAQHLEIEKAEEMDRDELILQIQDKLEDSK